jgi:sugar lactone lactonase YvrE
LALLAPPALASVVRTISTVAGGLPNNTPAIALPLNSPNGVAVDGAGNRYIADTQNYLVFKVDAVSGKASVIAGTGTAGYSGDGGPATAANLGDSYGLAVDAAGNLYIADFSSNVIRKVNVNGTVSTVAGNGTAGYSGDGGSATAAQLNNPWAVAVDAAGNLYIADYSNNVIRKVDGSGNISTVAALTGLSSPGGVAFDSAGNLYVADTGNQRIRKLDGSGNVSTVAGIGTRGFSGDGGPATAAQLYFPYAVAVDGSGNLYIDDYSNNRIRKVDGSGNISTVVGTGALGYSGDGGPATAAKLKRPYGMAVDSAGNLYIADTMNNVIRKVDGSGNISTDAGTGNIYFGGDGGPATGAKFDAPKGVAVDGAGNLYIADNGNNRIRKVDGSGNISTVAGNGTRGFSGDGGLATSAMLQYPSGLAVDGAGNLYIADSGNNRIRKVDGSGNISTFAGNGTVGNGGDGGAATLAQLNGPQGLSFDGAGNLYIADTLNDRIRKVDGSGNISTVAGSTRGYSGDGGLATAAQMFFPYAVAVDAAGNIYIADTSNYRIRKVNGSGIISTIAGTGSQLYSGDGGLATAAQIGRPVALALDGAGNLHVADANNNRVRLIDGSGIISTAIQPNGPAGLAFTSAGNFYLSDSGAGIISLVTVTRLAPNLSAQAVAGLSESAGLVSGTYSATSDEAATGYWVILPASASAPTAAQVKAGQDASGAAASFTGNGAMTAATAKSFSFSGLAPVTAYNLYFVVVAADGLSTTTTVQSTSFTTQTPPTLSAVSLSSLSSSSATLSITSNEAATGYWVVQSTTAGVPSVAQVKAGQDGSGATALFAGNGAMTAGNAKNFVINGLSASTAYLVYFVATDVFGTNTSVYFIARDSLGNTTAAPMVSSFPVAADTTPPTLSGIGVVGTTLSATSNEVATGYWVVLPAAASAPSVAQVKAGQDGSGSGAPFAGNGAMVASVARSFALGSLAAGTAYKVYLVARDTAGNDTTVQSLSFTTAADTTPPTLSNVAVSGIGSSGATLAATSDKAATGYWVVLPASASAPLLAQVKAGQDANGSVAAFAGNAAMVASTAKSFSLSGLAAGTAYQVYFVATDSAGNNTAVSALSFSTSGSSGGSPSTPSTTPSSTTTPTSTSEVLVDGNGTQSISSNALPIKIGSNAGGATLTVNTAQPLSLILNGVKLSAQASAGTQLQVVSVTAGGQPLLALAVGQGQVVLTANDAWQVLLAPGGRPVMAGRAGTQVSVSSSQIVVLSGSLVFSANAFAALKDDLLYAGEVAELNAAGKISRVRLGSVDGSGALAGDPLSLTNPPAGLSVKTAITRLAGTVTRLAGSLEKAVASALGGSGTQNANGTLAIVGNPSRNFLPLGDITIDTDLADGVSSTADGLTRVVKDGVVVTLAPAPRDLAQFTKDLQQVLPGATLTLRDGGVLVARVAGVDYVLRPDALVESASGAAGFVSGNDGVLRYRDGQGSQQSLYPAFYSYGETLALIAGLSSSVSASTNADGSVSFVLGGKTYTLSPDWTLSPNGTGDVARSLNGQKWWVSSDGKVYLYLSGGGQRVVVK